MILIPPTHGKAQVRAHCAPEYVHSLGEEDLRAELLRSLDQVFQDEVGAPAPRGWVDFDLTRTDDDNYVAVLVATAPTTAREVYIPSRAERRTLKFPVNTETRMSIVASPYRYDVLYPIPDHYLTFQGWDAETGLMVFDR